MVNRLLLCVVFLALLNCQRTVGASPITYDFAGTLKQPLNGTNQFTGSFTINGDPTPTQLVGGESGSDVLLSVSMGGQVFNFINTPLNPSGAAYSAYEIPAGQDVPMGVPEAVSTISGFQTMGSSSLSFVLTFYSPELPEQLTNLRTLSYPLDSSSVYITDDSAGSNEVYTGVVTSIELVSAPQPNALAVFALLGAAAMVYKRGRSPRDVGTQ
jgi:hypothetical protein